MKKEAKAEQKNQEALSGVNINQAKPEIIAPKKQANGKAIEKTTQVK
jgi:hypothetical protein